MSLGEKAVRQDNYYRLEKFIELEKNHKFDDARKNPQNYYSGVGVDLMDYKDSDEFKSYVEKYNSHVDKEAAIFIGWLLVLIFDVAMRVVCAIKYVASKLKNSSTEEVQRAEGQ